MTNTRITTITGMVGLAIALTVGSARAAVEDFLLEKGTITKEDWLKIKAEKEREVAQASPAPTSTVTNLLKGIELKATFYFDYTYATGDSFTGDVANKGINNPTANNNRGLATGFHFTRTYLTLIKRFDEGHHFRLTLDQMVNNVGGGNSCPNMNSSGGNCTKPPPSACRGLREPGATRCSSSTPTTTTSCCLDWKCGSDSIRLRGSNTKSTGGPTASAARSWWMSRTSRPPPTWV